MTAPAAGSLAAVGGQAADCTCLRHHGLLDVQQPNAFSAWQDGAFKSNGLHRVSLFSKMPNSSASSRPCTWRWLRRNQATANSAGASADEDAPPCHVGDDSKSPAVDSKTTCGDHILKTGNSSEKTGGRVVSLCHPLFRGIGVCAVNLNSVCVCVCGCTDEVMRLTTNPQKPRRGVKEVGGSSATHLMAVTCTVPV